MSVFKQVFKLSGCRYIVLMWMVAVSSFCDFHQAVAAILSNGNVASLQIIIPKTTFSQNASNNSGYITVKTIRMLLLAINY